jgi:hypothetical protein
VLNLAEASLFTHGRRVALARLGEAAGRTARGAWLRSTSASHNAAARGDAVTSHICASPTRSRRGGERETGCASHARRVATRLTGRGRKGAWALGAGGHGGGGLRSAVALKPLPWVGPVARAKTGREARAQRADPRSLLCWGVCARQAIAHHRREARRPGERCVGQPCRLHPRQTSPLANLMCTPPPTHELTGKGKGLCTPAMAIIQGG